MMQECLIVIQLTVGIVFLRAVLGKLRSPRSISSGIEAFNLVPKRLVKSVATLLVALEFVIAVSHISGRLMWPAAIATAVLLLVMLRAITIIITRGTEVSCACFGEGSDEIVSGKTTARLSLLLACEIVLLSGLVTKAYDGSLAMLRATDFLLALVAAALLAVISSWLLRLREFRSLWERCTACRKRQQP